MCEPVERGAGGREEGRRAGEAAAEGRRSGVGGGGASAGYTRKPVGAVALSTRPWICRLWLRCKIGDGAREAGRESGARTPPSRAAAGHVRSCASPAIAPPLPRCRALPLRWGKCAACVARGRG